jgi:hypothetical protein
MHIVKDLLYVLILFIAVYITFFLLHRHDTLEEKVARYDCRLAEFLPDFPIEVREECRRRSIERINQGKGV